MTALLAVAGRPTMPGGKPVLYTIPFSLKLTASTQFTKQTITGLTNGGTISTDSTGTATGGQTSWPRLATPGGSGSQWYLNQITTGAPVDLTGKYWRFRARQNLNSGSTRYLYWRFADSKTAHDAGNYVQQLIAPVATSTTSTANWLPDQTWVWDGIDPANDGVTVGTGVTSWASIGYIAVQIWHAVSTITWDIAEVQTVTKATGKAKCLFWHDDTTLSGAQALAAKLTPYSWKFSEACIWEAFGGGGDMAAGDATTYGSAGDVFTTHAITHAEHVSQTAQQLTGQAVRTRLAVWLRGVAGASPADFTWWGGQSFASPYIDVIRQFYRSGRGNTSLQNMPEMIPPADPHIYKSVLTAVSDTYTAVWKPAVDRAIATKGWVNFIYHQNLADAAGTNDSYKTDTDTLLAYLDAQRANIDVVTISDVMALCT